MTAATIPEPGDVIGGKFRIVRLLGQGGMGAVLEAENTLTGKRVAIKWLSPVLSTAQGKQRFLREAQAASRVRHPNVVDVYDFVHEGERLFLVMELLDGEPLTGLLERGGIPLHELCAMLIDAMRGVAAAHAQGVIHRDIKPDNIFLERQTDRIRLVPKVIDFGVSKLIDDVSLTQSGTAVGTPLYMSYEQLRGARDVDVRADVYSFGVILYEAMTGQTPYQADTLSELVVKITTTEPARAKLLRPELPTALDHMIHWAMAIDREQRLPSLEQMIRELEPFATENGFRAQMTLDGASMPKVAPSSDPEARPIPTPDTQPAARAVRAVAGEMPMAVAAGEAPARGGSRRVLLAVALLAALSLVAFALATGREPRAASSTPAASAVEAESKAESHAPAPAAAPTPAPQPAPPLEAVVAQPSPPAPSPAAAPQASPAKTAKKRVRKSAPAQTQPEAEPEPARAGFRAGRPRSEDF